MKNSIKTLAASLLTIAILTAATPNVQANNNIVTTLTDVKGIHKIVVTGNVELILVQNFTENLKVYDKYYAKNALVQRDGDILRISSFATERLTIVASVYNLSAIEASGNATVTTHGKFNLLSLDVKLKDSASADINASAIELFTSVKDNARLKLAGTATDYTALLGSSAKVSMELFSAENSSIRSVNPDFTAKIALTKESGEDIPDDFKL